MLRHTLALALAVSMSAGCNLYFGGDGGDGGDPCDEWGGSGDYDEALGLRNPDTGVCESWGTGGGGCNECGVCNDLPAGDSAAIALPSWGACQSECTGLGEGLCVATDGCRAIYGTVDGDPSTASYEACWQTDQSGVVADETCEVLDAWSCSTRDDCSAVHWQNRDGFVGPVGPFAACRDEVVGCYGDQDCAAGESCNAAEICLPPPGCDADADAACPAVCYGYCVPDDEPDPGSCYGDPLCPTLPPECPEGTVPGLAGGCWTGACIPVEECEPAPTCGEVASEDVCIGRDDCTALYQGVDCTCSADSCSCADWIFESCAAGSTR